MSTYETARPVACTLTVDELATRGARWGALAPAFKKEKLLDTGLRLVFEPTPEVESELRELAALEGECCGFAEWRVHSNGYCVLLDVTGTDELSIAAAQSIATRLQSNLVAAPTRRL